MRLHFRLSHWVLTASICSLLLYMGLIAYQSGAYPNEHPVFGAIFALTGNVVASFILYYLVVVFPETRKRNRIKQNCLKSYRYRKKMILHAIVSASIAGGRSDLSLPSVEIDELMSIAEFRKAFEGGREADEGIYAFSNYIQRNEVEFRAIVFQLNLIARELSFVLNNYDIDDQELFETVKRIEEVLFSTRELHADYDDEKRLTNLLFGMFTGFSIIEGYTGRDPIEHAIKSL